MRALKAVGKLLMLGVASVVLWVSHALSLRAFVGEATPASVLVACVLYSFLVWYASK